MASIGRRIQDQPFHSPYRETRFRVSSTCIPGMIRMTTHLNSRQRTSQLVHESDGHPVVFQLNVGEQPVLNRH